MSSLPGTKADFCLQIDYKRQSENPSRVFRAMSELIETMQFFDQVLVKSIDSKIEPVMLLEDIESGSIKAWLASVLRRVPDDAAYNVSWKPIIGQYLVKGKKSIIQWCEGKTTITNIDELKTLKSQLMSLASETQSRHPRAQPVALCRPSFA